MLLIVTFIFWENTRGTPGMIGYYTVFQKTGTLFVFAITLSTASQFA